MTEKEMNCEQALSQILAYLDRELGEDERSAMREHLHTCKSCYSRMEFERVIKDKLKALRDEKATPGVSKRIKALLKAF